MTDATTGIPGRRRKLPIGRVPCSWIGGTWGKAEGCFLGGVEVIYHTGIRNCILRWRGDGGEMEGIRKCLRISNYGPRSGQILSYENGVYVYDILS